MKLVSWNVNGLRAAIKKGFEGSFEMFDADVICLQEVRATPDQVEVTFPGYEMHWYPAEKKGYSGTAVISRIDLLSLSRGMGIAEHDNEGRVMTAELEDFFLVNVYTPNSGRGLVRLSYRTEEWDVEFRKYLKKLEGFGWAIAFVRRPLFQQPAIFVTSPDGKQLGVIEEDGTVNLESNFELRH